MFQFRPVAFGPDAPSYSPGRDVLNIGPQLVAIAVQAAIDCSEKEFWYKELMKYFGISKAEFQRFGPTLEGVFTRLDLEIKDALQVSGFSQLPPAVQAGFYVKLGQAFLASIHCALRNATSKGAVPQSVSDMVNEIKSILSRMPGIQ